MPRVTPPAFLFVPLLGLAAAAVSVQATTQDVSTAWELVSQHLPGEALARLKKNPPAGDREAAFARAVIMLDAQPTSDARLQDVIARLSELARGDDEIAEASAYFIGRVYQVHFFQPDFPNAARAYEALAAKHPEGYWAQLACVKLALLKLYVLPEPATPLARVAAAEALLEKVSTPALRRDLHLAIARTRLLHGLPDVLPHLLAADQIGGLADIPRADLQIQIGELSRRAGDFAQTKAYFEKFIAENEVDSRVYTVQLKLREIAAAPAPRKVGGP